LFIFMKPERLKKYWGYAAARDFGVLARLSEEACPTRPVTERKQSQNPKAPLRSSNRMVTGFLIMLLTQINPRRPALRLLRPRRAMAETMP
jgi:hypothetical protein